MVANIFYIFPADPPPPPPDPGDGVNRSKFNFLEPGHVAHQIKGNHEMKGIKHYQGLKFTWLQPFVVKMRAS